MTNLFKRNKTYYIRLSLNDNLKIYFGNKTEYIKSLNTNKPDGWYLPSNVNDVAIILETKAEDKNIGKQAFIDELFKNIDVISTKYKKTIGILYNGKDVAVYKNKELIKVATTLQAKQYYLDLYKENYIDKNKIYSLTKKINDLLHFKFGIKNLYHRMIFTASALVVERFGGNLEAIKNNGFNPFRNKIYDTLSKSLEHHKQQNLKIGILLEVYSRIEINSKHPTIPYCGGCQT